MTTELGTELGTILGTVLGTMDVTGPPMLDLGLSYALGGFTASDYYATQVGGGEQGDATSFAVFYLAQVGLAGTSQRWGGTLQAGAPFNGTSLQTTPAGLLNASIGNGTTAVNTASATSRTLLGSDSGRIHLIGYAYDAAGTRLRTFVDRAQEAGLNSAAGSAFVPNSSTAMHLGIRYDLALPATAMRYLGVLAIHGIPSGAQVTALYDAVRALGDLPSKAAVEALMPGVTVTHRWSVRDTLLVPNVPVVDGAAAPTTLADTVTAASVDAMTKTGSPVVRVLDPGLYPRTSYGVMGFVTGSDYATAAGAGPRGSATFTFGMKLITWSVAGPIETFAACLDGAYAGWDIYRNTTSLVMRAAATGGALISAPTVTLATTDVGVPLYVILQVTGGSLRAFIARGGVVAEATPATAITGFAAASAAEPFRIGRSGYATPYPATNMTWLGASAGNVAPTPTELQQWVTDSERTGRVVALPGASHWYEPSAAYSSSGGTTAPATITNLLGSGDLTRVGTGLQISQRTERLWSYETTPILQGAEAFTLLDYFEALVNALPGDPAGFTVSLLAKVVSQSVPSTTRRLFSQRAATNPGWEFGSVTTNSALNFSLGGANTITITSSVAAADVGKLGLFTGVWDATAGVGRLFAKRAQVGTGSALSGGFSPNTGVKPMIGRRSDGSPSDGIAIYGVYYAPGIATLAQYQAQWDACQATERMQACPGLPGVLIDLTTDVLANGGVLSATLADRGAGGVDFSRVGAPALSSQYARAWTA